VAAVPTRRPEPRGGFPMRRQEPINEFEDLQDRLGRLFENVWSGVGDGQTWSPLVDVEETEDAWILEADLPGVKRSDINVEANQGEVTITGEIKERERKGILRRRTRRTGQFELRVALPGDIDPDNIEATLHDGVLNVRIPKSERARPKRVEVKSA
jgi:HSP20 family protein